MRDGHPELWRPPLIRHAVGKCAVPPQILQCKRSSRAVAPHTVLCHCCEAITSLALADDTSSHFAVFCEKHRPYRTCPFRNRIGLQPLSVLPNKNFCSVRSVAVRRSALLCH